MITNKNLQNIIEKNNKIWSDSTDAERRVLLAKDALERLTKGQIKARRGKLTAFRNTRKLVKEEASIQEVIAKGEVCQACALGSLMISQVFYKNKVKASQYWTGLNWGDNNADELRNLFGHELRKMEYAFENGEGLVSSSQLRSGEGFDCRKFFSKYRDSSTKRLEAILKNVIRNKGEFIPSQF